MPANLSLGHPIYAAAASDPLVQAVEATVRAGIVVVVSACNVGVNASTGQVGYAGITSPGNAPSAITVGALKTFDTTTPTDDVIADYSSRGPTWYGAYAKPDLVAPGHRLLGFSQELRVDSRLHEPRELARRIAPARVEPRGASVRGPQRLEHPRDFARLIVQPGHSVALVVAHLLHDLVDAERAEVDALRTA